MIKSTLVDNLFRLSIFWHDPCRCCKADLEGIHKTHILQFILCKWKLQEYKRNMQQRKIFLKLWKINHATQEYKRLKKGFRGNGLFGPSCEEQSTTRTSPKIVKLTLAFLKQSFGENHCLESLRPCKNARRALPPLVLVALQCKHRNHIWTFHSCRNNTFVKKQFSSNGNKNVK